MPRGFQLKIVRCLRCGYRWSPRVRRPRVCPNCGSPYWDVPRRRRTR